MPFTTGTSDNQNDLLLDLKTWLTGLGGGNAWTQLAWTAGATPTDIARLHIRAPGAGTGKEVFINIQTRNDPSLGAYAWAVSGAIGYDSNAAWGAQPEEGSEAIATHWENSIDYWFYANTRRVIVVAKISSSYIPLYAGFYLPFATPDEHHFPLFIGGNYPVLASYSVANTRNRFFVDPGSGAAYYKPRGSSTWRAVENHYTGDGAVNPNGGTNAVMWPHRVPKANPSVSDDWNKLGISSLRPNEDGELPAWTPHIIDPARTDMPGALDGVLVVPGFGRSSEQTTVIDGITYRLFQNISRSTERDFLAIAEV